MRDYMDRPVAGRWGNSSVVNVNSRRGKQSLEFVSKSILLRQDHVADDPHADDVLDRTKR